MIAFSCGLNNVTLIYEIKHFNSLQIKMLYMNEKIYIDTVYMYIYCENNIGRE